MMAQASMQRSSELVKQEAEDETLEEKKQRHGLNASRLTTKIMAKINEALDDGPQPVPNLVKALAVVASESREWLGIRHAAQAAPQVHLVNRISVISGHGAIPTVLDSVQDDNIS